MRTPAQYLADCKTKMGHCSDYALAKAWDIDKGYMSKVLRGKVPINAHVAFRIAITLELDPATVLAEIEAQQQTGKQGEFWRGFLSRVQTLALVLATLVSLGSVTCASAPAAAGGNRRLRYCV